ncbi:hypothetical protein RhiirA1_468128 [Rhizophagus irregularis]|uniref:Uncharacterized protein n=1 Tax=Rhizophagus irregularis TaxID=588596 RepID=A0A2N0RAM0_9GLOM|nr:hypothetical protein RhiirA1_468128 [Rhizophagus irregularis]
MTETNKGRELKENQNSAHTLHQLVVTSLSFVDAGIDRWRVNFANFLKNNSSSIDARKMILVLFELSQQDDSNKL